MTTKNFNAKKVLMSTIAAVVFSFVFTTSANAATPKEVKNNGTEIRQPFNDNRQEAPQDIIDIISYILQTVFGVRV
jgi:hypothetical protein